MSELLERGTLLAELDHAVAEDPPRGRVALVTGEAGSGKSALVRSFARRQEGRAEVLVGLCDPLALSRPLGPLHDINAQIGAGLVAMPAFDDRAEVFAAFLGVLERAHRRIVVVFEDVHWADDATLDLLAFLGRRLDRTSALIVLTYRDDELGVPHPLHAVLASLPSERVSYLRLPPLSRCAVSALSHPAGYDGAELYRLTGGNPLLITELLAAGSAMDAPPGVRALIRARLAGLSAAARDAVRLVAISPDGAEPWLLEGAGPAGPAVLEECLCAGLLSSIGGRIRFRHELLRRTVHDALPAFARRELNRRVLGVLTSRPSGREVNPARLVHHAGECGDTAAVLRYARAAVRMPEQHRAELFESFALHLLLAGEAEQAVAARQTALAMRETAGQQEKVGENLRLLSRLYWWTGRRERAEAAASRAVETLEPGGDGPQLALAYGNLAQLDVLAHAPATAIAFGRKAMRMATRLDDPVSLAPALIDLGTARLAAGDAAGRRDLNQGHALAQEHGLIEDAARAWVNLAADGVARHDPRQGPADLDRAFGFATGHELPGIVAQLLSLRSWQRLGHGDWTGAEEDALAVLVTPRPSGPIVLPALCALGRLQARRGQASATGLLREAAVPAWKMGEVQGIALVAAAQAEHAWLGRGGNPDTAELTAAFELAHRVGHPWYAGELAWWLRRAGATPPVSDWYAEPYRLLLTGNWRDAAEVWRELSCPYEEAEALACGGDGAATLRALETFDRLGAKAAARRLRHRLRRLGGLRVPRGPRPATVANPANLTARQLEVLALLAEGLRNVDIAARLMLSVRTVDHHVAAILAKLAVDSRRQAAAAARRLGIVADHREPCPAGREN
ncbi:ATP-binding protein [Amycolatopsis sp. NPDC088138]|uniref:ATP-binding protein n=1 Tax=Amycolatopsis sp. NPDC088138 TaxID=3363938 RepID=UPI003810F44B